MGTLLVLAASSCHAEIAAALALAKLDGELLHAASSSEALKTVAECRRAGRLPELIVIEAAPETDGLALCRKVRQLADLRTVAIVALTPAGDQDAIAAAFDAGATDCISRPLHHRELAARVRAALEVTRERARQTQRGRTLRKQTQELVAANERLERLACVDPLTGVANRRQLDTVLEAEWARAVRAGTPLAVIMADLDFFHDYNERYGHPAGDACLRRVADALAASLRRPSDFLGRYGGEEFLALLPDTALEGVALAAERCRVAVEALALPHERSACAPVVTISAGVAWTQPPGGTPDTVVSAADAMLYVVKHGGRNRVGGVSGLSGLIVPRRPAPGETWPAPEFVDPSLAGRIPALLQRKKAEMPLVRTTLAAGDFERLRFVARDLKNAAALHGLDGLARIAARMDGVARAADDPGAAASVAELDWYLDRVQVVYRRRTNPPPCS